mmetsp:Transcript_58803/g.127639  ORF Transcript_58803/g.127639 Transcript_58803/m.127639 type:complete len:399 (-) Transcript_58803:294-1490(-)
MGLVPHGSSNHNLHLLSTGKSGHTVVSGEFRVKTTILQVVLHVGRRKGTDVKTGTLGELGINGLAHLGPTIGGKVLDGAVALFASLVLHFVLVLLVLVLTSVSNELRHHSLGLADNSILVLPGDLERSLLLGLLLGGQLHGNLNERLLVLTVSVSPSDVLVGGLVQVSLNVVESVLGHVSDTSIGVLPHIASLGNNFPSEHLDHGTLTSTVLTHASDTGSHGHLDGDIEKGGHGVSGVREVAVTHLHEGLGARLDTLDGTGLRETELQLGLLEGEVSHGIGVLGDKAVEVTLVDVELQSIDLHDVGTAVVQESGIVGHHDTGDLCEGVDVVLHPSDVDHIQVIGGFIQKQNICLLKHGSGHGKLHSPSSGEGGHGVVRLSLTILGETDSGHDAEHFVA